MYEFDIPGRERLEIENIVFDYNGTIAVDGGLFEEVKEMLPILAENANIYILTADTFGSVRRECEGLPVEIMTFPKDRAAQCKEEIVQSLSGGVACIGNGYNDILMCDAAELSIAVLSEEATCSALLMHTDIFVPSIKKAMEIFTKDGRLVATLRG